MESEVFCGIRKSTANNSIRFGQGETGGKEQKATETEGGGMRGDFFLFQELIF